MPHSKNLEDRSRSILPSKIIPSNCWRDAWQNQVREFTDLFFLINFVFHRAFNNW